MKSPRFWAMLILLVLVAMSGPVGAAGPLDAVYSVTLTFETGQSFLMFLVAIQNDTQIGFALLDPDIPDWYYGFGALDAQQRMTGLLFYGDSTEVGQFDLRFQSGTVMGTVTIFEFPLTASGGKFF
jgi:hypothetical protein